MAKKVFHVIECGELTGCGKMVAAIANGLDADAFESTLIYATRPGTSKAIFEGLFNNNIKKIYLKEMVRKPSFFKDVKALIKLYFLFKNKKPDVIHLHSSKAGFLGRLAAFGAGISATFYSPYGYSFRMTDTKFLFRKLYFFLEKIASKQGYIVATSPNEKIDATNFAGPGRIIEGYNGIDLGKFEMTSSPRALDQLTVVACGRITAAKNPESFVRLSGKALTKYQKIKFIWIGSGSTAETDAIQNYVKNVENADVHFTGWISDADLKNLMRSADIFVHYSSWDALPLSVTEAMALGKPILASPAVEQVVHGENGFVAENEQVLFDFFCRLADSPELRKLAGKKSREIAEKKYNIDHLVHTLSRHYVGLSEEMK